MSNPLIDDPSIITISNNHETTNNNHNPHHEGSLAHLNPGNALSKLLDSAMAAAAKETTPEFEYEPSKQEDLRIINSFVPKNSDLIYTPQDLLKLRDSPLVVDYSDKIPDAKFWRLKTKPLHAKKDWNYSEKTSDFNHKSHRSERNSKAKKNHNSIGSGNVTFREKNQKGDFFSTDDYDDEKVPEWDMEDVNEDMGRTVEDFEKWKAKMKLDERRKNGENVDEDTLSSSTHINNAQKAGNEIDSFFSFAKPIQSKPSLSTQDSSSRSSRFSSFFKPEASAVTTPTADPVNSAPLEDKRGGSSRILSFIDGDQFGSPALKSPDQDKHAVQQSNVIQSQSAPTEVVEEKKPANDSFFMSLLNKSKSQETTANNTPKQTMNVMDLFNKTVQSEQAKAPQSGSPQVLRNPSLSAPSTESPIVAAPHVTHQSQRPDHQISRSSSGSIQQQQQAPPSQSQIQQQQYVQQQQQKQQQATSQPTRVQPPPGNLNQHQQIPQQRQQIPPWMQQQMSMSLPQQPMHMGQFPPNIPPHFMPPPPNMNSMNNMNIPPQFRQNGIPPQMNPNQMNQLGPNPNQINPNMPHPMHPNFNPYINMPPPPPPNFGGQNHQIGKDYPPSQLNHQQMYNQGNITMGNRNMDPRMMGAPPGMGAPGPIQNSK